jgi:pimeloyl-ACP methyl ester carboxylesterase
MRDIFSREKKDMPFLSKAGPLFLLSSAANIGWIFAWHYEQVLLSLLIMLVLLGSLLAIYVRLNIGRGRRTGGRKFNLMSWQGFAIITSKPRVDELKKLNIPTLVIHGDKDKLFDYANGEALARLIPNAKFITIKGGGHMFPQVDTRNDEYIAEIISHIQSE